MRYLLVFAILISCWSCQNISTEESLSQNSGSQAYAGPFLSDSMADELLPPFSPKPPVETESMYYSGLQNFALPDSLGSIYEQAAKKHFSKDSSVIILNLEGNRGSLIINNRTEGKEKAFAESSDLLNNTDVQVAEITGDTIPELIVTKSKCLSGSNMRGEEKYLYIYDIQNGTLLFNKKISEAYRHWDEGQTGINQVTTNECLNTITFLEDKFQVEEYKRSSNPDNSECRVCNTGIYRISENKITRYENAFPYFKEVESVSKVNTLNLKRLHNKMKINFDTAYIDREHSYQIETGDQGIFHFITLWVKENGSSGIGGNCYDTEYIGWPEGFHPAFAIHRDSNDYYFLKNQIRPDDFGAKTSPYKKVVDIVSVNFEDYNDDGFEDLKVITTWEKEKMGAATETDVTLYYKNDPDKEKFVLLE